MSYHSIESKVKEVAAEFRKARQQNNTSIHFEKVRAILYLQSIFGDDAEKIDMVIELARKQSQYNLEAE